MTTLTSTFICRATLLLSLLVGTIVGGGPDHRTCDRSLLNITAHRITGALVDSRDRAIIVTGDRVLILDSSTGTIRHSVSLGTHTLLFDGAKLALDPIDGLAFVTTAAMSHHPPFPGQFGPSFEGYVDVVSLRQGRIVHSFPTGRRLAMVAVDSYRRRLIMAINGVRALKKPGSITVIDIRHLRGVTSLSLGVGARVSAVDNDARTGRSLIAWQDTDARNISIGPGHVTILDTATGRVEHVIALAPEPIHIAMCEQCKRAYVLSDTGQVTTIDTTNGHVVRVVAVEGANGEVAIDEQRDRVFVVMYGASLGEARIATLDATSGALLRTIAIADAPENVLASNIVVDHQFHHVFVEVERLDRTNQPTAGGRIIMLDATSGTVLRKVKVGNDPNGMAVDEGTGRVFVATVGQVDPSRGNNPSGDGDVYVLDARTGSIRHVVCVEVGPGLIAVAAQVHRVFVLNEGGTVTVRIGGTTWRQQPPWLRPCQRYTPSQGRIECNVAGSISVIDTKAAI